MATELIERQPSPGRSGTAWSPLFVSRLVFFIALGCSSGGSLARYLPAAFPSKALLTGVFFGIGLAGFAYVLMNLRNSRGPLSRREEMILAPLVLVVVALLATRVILLFHG